MACWQRLRLPRCFPPLLTDSLGVPRPQLGLAAFCLHVPILPDALRVDQCSPTPKSFLSIWKPALPCILWGCWRSDHTSLLQPGYPRMLGWEPGCHPPSSHSQLLGWKDPQACHCSRSTSISGLGRRGRVVTRGRGLRGARWRSSRFCPMVFQKGACGPFPVLRTFQAAQVRPPGSV